MIGRVIIALAATLALASPLAAQTGTGKTTRVQFAAGTSSKTLKGAVKGYDGIDYVISARARQTLKVRLDSKLAYFNVLPPGSDVAVYNGSISGPKYAGVMAASGDYVVRVYLMRNEARRGQSAPYTLTLSIAG